MIGAYNSYDDMKLDPDYMQPWSEVLGEDEDLAYDNMVENG